MKSLNPALTPAEIIQSIVSTSQTVAALDGYDVSGGRRRYRRRGSQRRERGEHHPLRVRRLRQSHRVDPEHERPRERGSVGDSVRRRRRVLSLTLATRWCCPARRYVVTDYPLSVTDPDGNQTTITTDGSGTATLTGVNASALDGSGGTFAVDDRPPRRPVRTRHATQRRHRGPAGRQRRPRRLRRRRELGAHADDHRGVDDDHERLVATTTTTDPAASTTTTDAATTTTVPRPRPPPTGATTTTMPRARPPPTRRTTTTVAGARDNDDHRPGGRRTTTTDHVHDHDRPGRARPPREAATTTTTVPLPPPPDPPTDLIATAGDGTVTLSWTAPTGGVNGYRVYDGQNLVAQTGALGITFIGTRGRADLPLLGVVVFDLRRERPHRGRLGDSRRLRPRPPRRRPPRPPPRRRQRRPRRRPRSRRRPRPPARTT